jgi:hypothetical protein
MSPLPMETSIKLQIRHGRLDPATQRKNKLLFTLTFLFNLDDRERSFTKVSNKRGRGAAVHPIPNDTQKTALRVAYYKFRFIELLNLPRSMPCFQNERRYAPGRGAHEA